MVYYSDLIGKPIIDKNNKKISVVRDFSFIDKSRYAVVSGIILVINKSRKIIPWKYISEIGDKPEDPFPLGIYLNEELEKIKKRLEKERHRSPGFPGRGRDSSAARPDPDVGAGRRPAGGSFSGNERKEGRFRRRWPRRPRWCCARAHRIKVRLGSQCRRQVRRRLEGYCQAGG